MMGNRSRLMNFVKKFIGTVRFRNDHFSAIMGYEDYMIGDSMISRGSNLYTISVEDVMKSSPICLLSKASKNKSWLWHHRLNHLNFSTINDLARKDLNGIVERRNQTLMFLWAEAVATACYTQNRSLIHTRHNKTLYELVHDKKPGLKFLGIFGALCYLTNDSEDLGKLKTTTDIGIFVGYVPNRKGPEPILLTPRQISSGLVPDPVLAAPYVPPTNKDLEILFQLMFGEYFEPPSVERSVPLAPAVQVLLVSAGTPSSTTIDQDAPSTSYLPSSSMVQPPISHQGVAAGPTIEDNPFAQAGNDPFVNVFALEPSSDESSSGGVSSAESTQVVPPHNHLRKWSNDHPLDNVIGNPSRPVSTKKQLATDALWCLYNSKLSKVEPKNVKTIMDEACWFEAIQEEIYKFDWL
ncbi:retrovirus-related pol polyprotein from transposon TNT 1-94 [Tanacetum coccineum]